MMDHYRIYKHAWVYNGAPHCEPCLSSDSIQTMLGQGGWMIRNTYDFDTKEPTDFWYVIKDHFGDMQELSTKTRNQVRRGLANYTIRRIKTDEIIQHGYPILRNAAESYKITTQVPSESEFLQRIEYADQSSEFWGAFNKEDQMVAFAINKINEDCCDYQTLKALPAAMKDYVFYALIFEMNRYYLQERQLKYVLDGARSITEHSNIQPCLEEKFNFRKAYCHLKMYYTWWFGILVRCLYPFRRFIKNNRIHAVLAMHSMQR